MLRNLLRKVLTTNNKKGADLMTVDDREYYQKVMEEERQEVLRIREQIQKEIESVCRDEEEVKITGYGFDSLSPILYDTSIQKKVVDLLMEDGYRCMLHFKWINGKPQNYLTISWK